MIKNKFNLKSTSIIGAGIAVALTGCTSTHTEKFNETDREIDLNSAKVNDAHQRVAPNERPLTRVIDDFYVDTTPMAIIKEDKNSLPAIFHKKMVYFSKNAVNLNQLAGDIYNRTGLSIDFIYNENEKEEEVLVEEVDTSSYVPPAYFNPNQTENVSDSISYEDELADETKDTIYIEHNGTLKELLDYVAVKKGLKWKFDQNTNKIFVYKFETRTFTVLGFNDEIEKDSRITTDMSSSSESSDDGGSSSTNNSQTISMKAKQAQWESIKENIESVISSKGKVSFNDAQGKIIVTDDDFTLSNVENLVDDFNSDAMKEIALKVQVLNVTMNDSRNIDTGVDVSALNDKLNISLGGLIDSTAPTNNLISFADNNTKVMLDLLDNLGKTSVENSINAVTLNNIPVPIQLTQNRSYIEQISTEESSDDGDETTDADIGIVSEGITMNATPKAVGQNVLLDYSLNLSVVDSIDDAPGDIPIQLPITSTKNFIQRVSLRNGMPRVVLTIERDLLSNTSEHPIYENLWFLGGSEGVEKKRDVLMVVVTPYITDLTK